MKLMNRELNKVKHQPKRSGNSLYGLLAFVLGMGYMLITLLVLYDFGNLCILCGDLRSQYIPAIKSLCRDLLSGNSIFYSQEIGFGINTALYNAYYAYSPFNMFYLFFLNADELTVTYFVIALKSGLAALSFQKFIAYSHKVNGILSVLWSLFYCMASYQIIYNTKNIIWLDAFFILPVVFLCIDRVFEEEKWLGLVLAYTYTIFTQFYMGYMIAIASVLYFVAKIIIFRKVYNVKAVLTKYIGAGLCSIVLSSFAWIPALVFMLNNSQFGGGEYANLQLNILDIYNQLFWGEVNNAGGYFPYIYCGILVVLLLPAFFINKEFETKEKLLWGISLAELVISCLISPVYMMWHGFDKPNQFGFRFSFIVSFYLCVIAAKTMNKGRKISKQYLARVIAINALIYALQIILQTNKWGKVFTVNDWMGLGINVLLMLVWGTVLFRNNTGEKRNNFLTSTALLVLVFIECLTNSYCIFYKNEAIAPTTTSVGYLRWKKMSEKAIDEVKEDTGFFRVNYRQSLIPNSSVLFGYRGASYFSSAENIPLRYELEKLGIYTSERFVEGAGYTDATNMLFGIKYNLYGYENSNENEDKITQIVKNDNVLGLGYMVCGEAKDYSLTDYNAFENNNYLFSTMTGENVRIFEGIDDSTLQYEANGMYYAFVDDCFQVGNSGDDDNNRYVRITVPGNVTEPIYAFVLQEVSQHCTDAFLLNGGSENALFDYGSLSVSYFKELLKGENGQYLEIISIPGKTVEMEKFGGILFYRMDEKKCGEIYDNLKNNQWKLEVVKDGYFKGTIESTEDKKLMFTTIPYEKGWTLVVDGRPQEITPLLDGTLVGIELDTPGIHTIEMSYSELKEIKETFFGDK